jgi:hypothetical protein
MIVCRARARHAGFDPVFNRQGNGRAPKMTDDQPLLTTRMLGGGPVDPTAATCRAPPVVRVRMPLKTWCNEETTCSQNTRST